MTDPTSISQSSFGEGSQNIALNPGVAIAKVEQLILHFHISPQKIRTLDRFWKSWSQDTNPPFNPDLVIGGREKERERVISWLRGNPAVLALQGESQKEVSAFLAAVVQRLEPEERSNVLGRAVITDCKTSWQHLIESSAPLILIIELADPEGIGQAIQNGHHVFVSCDRLSSDRENLLPRIVHDAAAKALQEMGLNRNTSHSYATLARRSLSALRRKLAIANKTQHPAWAKPNDARVLLAPLLVSVWSDSYDGDRKVLEQLSGQSYDAIQTQLVRWANEPDAPIRRVGDVWTIASPEDAWILIARYLTDDDLTRFEDVAVEVLSELDPKFELPPEKRLMANIYGKVLTRSNWLREGILEMLTLMATRSPEISFSASRSGEDVANRVVWRLMEQAKDNPILWASLSDKLPLLAEAAPEILLDAIETGLAGENPILISLFQDRTSRLALSSPHNGLLWALQRLALHPDYLSRSALSLARLTRLDQDGNLGNRPKSSLETIFIWWLYFHPQAKASLPNCLQIIDIIYKREPDVAWNLSMSLISYHHMSLMERKTRWRDWVTETGSTFIIQDLMDVSDAILDKLIANAGLNMDRWCSLIDRARSMNANQKDLIVDSLEILKSQQLSFEERVQISDCLRHEISDYRESSSVETQLLLETFKLPASFSGEGNQISDGSNNEAIDYQECPNSPWSMSIENIQRLEAILTQLEPDDLVYRHRELFKYCIELPGKHDLSPEERDKIAENLRLEALREILNLQGWDGVIQLAQQVQAPSFIGVALAQAQLLPIDLTLFLREHLGSPDQWRHKLASSYVFCNDYQNEQWIDDCLKDDLPLWSAEEYGKFLLCLRFDLRLLDRLDTATSATQSYFWCNVKRVEFLDIEQTDWVLAKLLEFGRPHLAVTQIAWNLKDKPELFSLDRIAEALEVSVQTEPSKGFDSSDFAYDSAKLLNYLEKTEFSCDRLANLELAYFQIHTHYRSPQILFDRLSKNPEFFVEALQCISHAENQTEVNRNDEHPNQSLAELFWHLLERWKQLPGVLEDGRVDEIALKSWVFNVCELAAECDRSNIADCYIGYRLSFSPVDPDGAWPHRVVRDLIELANSTVKDSWHTQIYNNRGLTSRSSTDGGKQERVIAEKYVKDAKQIGNQWPQTAAILRKLAKGYNREAAKEDVSAELTQDFWR